MLELWLTIFCGTIDLIINYLSTIDLMIDTELHLLVRTCIIVYMLIISMLTQVGVFLYAYNFNANTSQCFYMLIISMLTQVSVFMFIWTLLEGWSTTTSAGIGCCGDLPYEFLFGRSRRTDLLDSNSYEDVAVSLRRCDGLW